RFVSSSSFMSMPQPDHRSLLGLTLRASAEGRYISDNAHRLDLGVLQSRHFLNAPLATMNGRSAFIACEKQLPAVLTAIALDGIARRIVLGLPGMAPAHLSSITTLAGVDVVVSDNSSKQVIPGVASVSCHFDSHFAGSNEDVRADET